MPARLRFCPTPPSRLCRDSGKGGDACYFCWKLAAHYRPSEVSDPTSPAAAANGQYILIRREAYDAVGGHAAVADNILEDVELARAVKRS